MLEIMFSEAKDKASDELPLLHPKWRRGLGRGGSQKVKRSD
jgi:hypothetical protein